MFDEQESGDNEEWTPEKWRHLGGGYGKITR